MRKLLARGLWMTVLAIWLILWGLSTSFGLKFNGLELVLGVLAIATGVLILLGR